MNKKNTTHRRDVKPCKKGFRILENMEVIQEGDECEIGIFGGKRHWEKVDSYLIGKKATNCFCAIRTDRELIPTPA